MFGEIPPPPLSLKICNPSRPAASFFFLSVSPPPSSFAGAPLSLDSPPHCEDFPSNPTQKLLIGGIFFSFHSVQRVPWTSIFRSLQPLSNIDVTGTLLLEPADHHLH
ncbi:hypothetical protein Salat_2160700 [Sesamum alatum]|uniref:Uncharacterized protein n=1 Tax=Sesamum alatum TaxID=300844 RepID=A0AAE1Y2K5_9LAMI|nr:hypothetical protein Salat_2160700 [Sesamum alatum]